MKKLTRDEERFKSTLKKSKSKILHRGESSSGQVYWYFEDVDQTGFHPVTITDLIVKDLVSFGLMTQKRYHGTIWIGQH